MKSRIFALILCVASVEVIAAEIWVAPTGSDRNPGTPAAPLASPHAAVRQARELRRLAPADAKGGVRIVLRGGIYPLNRTLIFSPEDSGTAESPTVLEAAEAEQAVLSGGVALANWTPVEGTVAGMSDGAVGRIWKAHSPTFDGRRLEFRQLWVAGRKAVRARSPNGEGMEHLTAWNREREEAGVPAQALGGLKSAGVAEMIVAQQWEIAILRLRDIRIEGDQARVTFHQPESRIEFEHPWPQPILRSEGGSGAFFLANALEFLDSPGEWFHDVGAGLVYYWPHDGEDMGKVEVIAPALEQLVRIEGSLDRPVSHVVFKGIQFQHTTWLRPSFAGHVPLQAGMYITEAYKLRPAGTPDWRSLDNQTWTGRAPAGVVASTAKNIRFERCSFEHMAMSGLDMHTGTQDNVVEGCLFRDIGNNGIQLGPVQGGAIEAHLPYAPTDEREITARHRVANNLLKDCANEDWGGVAILAGYVRDTTIEHNEIAGTSYTGISLGWGWTRTPNIMRRNVVRANRLDRVATRMCDDAGIYTLSAQPGSLVAENVITEIKMSPYVDRPDHWFYLYTDEGSSYITVRDNWCPEPKFLQNATGPGNVWENNGPMVSEKIKAAAGLEPAFQDLRKR